MKKQIIYIKIMGAGLSGLTAAINLAKAGFNVDVFENRDDCGKRFQGDINGLENWSSQVDAISEFESMNSDVLSGMNAGASY